jgi:transposase
VEQNFQLNPFQKSLFLFCGKRCDRLKGLYWEEDGVILLYKRLESGHFQWPRNEEAVRNISWQELRWLLEGLSIDQPKAVRKIHVGSVL